MREQIQYIADDGTPFPTAELCLEHEARFKGKITDFPLLLNDANAATIGDYFRALLVALWKKGEGFSGKWPFGNSGWEYVLYESLVRAGVVKGTFRTVDTVEYLDDCDVGTANRIIKEAIEGFGK